MRELQRHLDAAKPPRTRKEDPWLPWFRYFYSQKLLVWWSGSDGALFSGVPAAAALPPFWSFISFLWVWISSQTKYKGK